MADPPSAAAGGGAASSPLVAEELLTPPLGLVALLGRADLHPAIREHLRTELRPPLECCSAGAVVGGGCDDLADASRVIGAVAQPKHSDAPTH